MLELELELEQPLIEKRSSDHDQDSNLPNFDTVPMLGKTAE